MKKNVVAISAGLLFMLSPLPILAAEKVKIAFVCTGNTGRSVTAEALAQRLIDKKELPVLVISRGVDVDPFETSAEAPVQQLLKADPEIELSGHHATQLTDNDVRHADVVLTATANHKQRIIGAFPYAKDKTFSMAEYATGSHVDVVDAWGKPLPEYQAMIEQVGSYIEPILDKAMSLKKTDG